MSKSKFDTQAQPTLSRAEQETQTAAERLSALIEDALAAVAVRTKDGVGELDAVAQRIERAARDLSVALRELAQRRQTSADD
ncbi:MAG TPA: hypothetical protein VGV38_10860 [Pyrinomonadaceae bacterium]|nr:hypothetical protein [Pyrinomonadaceae bacterium]